MLEEKLVDYFQKIPHIVSVTLFGSFARYTVANRGDVDIAVLFEKSNVPDTFGLFALREEISDLVHKDVDIVCLNTASPIIGMHAFQDGKLLLKKNTRAYDNYQMALFVDYAELKEIRAVSEKNILSRKFYSKSWRIY